jgi:23S rRNA (uracil1939-C5)-methyltransferase
MITNRRFLGTCVDYTHDGKGVFKVDGMPIFVPGVLVGEEANIVITNIRGQYAEGRLESLVSRSAERVDPPCPFYQDCGGCQIQHLSYKEQLKMKKARVAEVLRRIGGYNGKIGDIIGSDNPFHYRNKIQFPFGKNADGQLITGLYRAGTHKVIDIDSCLIENAEADAITQVVKNFCIEHHLEPYDQKYKKGFLRHVMVRKGHYTGQIMVVLVTGKINFPQKQAFVNTLTAQFPQIKTIVHNMNPEFTDVILGYREHILYGEGYIEDVIEGITFRIAAKSFYQVNPTQAEVLYKAALKMVQLTKDDVVLDAYSGVGTLTLLATKLAKHVTGVEIIKDAVLNAIENAKINQIKNVSFIERDAAQFMVERAEKGKTYDVVMVDPPRQGCGQGFLESVIKVKPKKILYISCEPSSLARDIKYLSSFYEVKEVVPVDMFSQTFHVETVALLCLKI